MSVFLAALSAVAYGAADFAGGKASRGAPVPAVLVISQSFGLLGALVLALALRQQVPAGVDFLWGVAAGLSGIVGLASLYTGLATASVAVVSPTAALIGTAAPILAGVLFGESPSALGWAGIAVALPSILLLSLARDAERGLDLRSLGIGVLAGLGFGGYYILIDRTSDASGFWPLVSARVASVVLVMIFAWWRRIPLAMRNRRPRANAIVAGMLDMAANVFFLVSVRAGLLVTTAVLSSLYPGPTVLLSRLVDGERLGNRRAIGLALALCGVGLMAAGAS